MKTTMLLKENEIKIILTGFFSAIEDLSGIV